MTETQSIEVFEFFSGIGGFRLALCQAVAALPSSSASASASASLSVTNNPRQLRFTAFDSSQVVNSVYEHNVRVNGLGKGRPDDPPASSHDEGDNDKVHRVNIESLSLKQLNGKAHIWTMSPPCQPFTTTARSHRKDLNDARNKGFVHLMSALRQLEKQKRPQWIFFENVKGFQNSETHKLWVTTLMECNYVFKQYLLTPLQFRIPNNRMRFYMVCRLSHTSPAQGDNEEEEDDHSFSTDINRVVRMPRPCACTALQTLQVNNGVPLNVSFDTEINHSNIPLHKLHEICHDDISGPPGTNPLRPFLDPSLTKDRQGNDVDDDDGGRGNTKFKSEYSELLVSNDNLRKKWAMGLSYCGEEDKCTFCFTSSYGQTYHKSSGSLFHMKCPRGKRLSRVADMSLDNRGQVRLFSPQELTNMFGFSTAGFEFPPDMTLRNRFKVIGQSVNVCVVRAVIHSELCHAVKRESGTWLTTTCLRDREESKTKIRHPDSNSEDTILDVKRTKIN